MVQGIPVTAGDTVQFGLAGTSTVTLRLVLNLIDPQTGQIAPGPGGELTAASTTDRSATGLTTAVKAASYTFIKPYVITSANVETVAGSNAPQQPGIVWCFAQVIRAGRVVALLIAGYYYVGAPGPSFPGPLIGMLDGPGRVYNAAPSSPAAGSELTITVPTKAMWRIMSLNIKLVRDANTANVTHHLVIDDGTSANVIDQGNGETPAAVATNTRNYLYEPGRAVALETSFDANNYIRLPLLNPPGSKGLLLWAGSRIRTVTTSIQVGDQYSVPQLWVEEWFTG